MCEMALVGSIEVLHEYKSHVDVGGELTQQLLECFKATGRCADADYRKRAVAVRLAKILHSADIAESIAAGESLWLMNALILIGFSTQRYIVQPESNGAVFTFEGPAHMLIQCRSRLLAV